MRAPKRRVLGSGRGCGKLGSPCRVRESTGSSIPPGCGLEGYLLSIARCDFQEEWEIDIFCMNVFNIGIFKKTFTNTEWSN